MSQRSTISSASHLDGAASLLDAEFIGVFTRMAAALGFPKSVGEIYGVLFAAQGALSFDAIVQRLGLSTGSVSYGLRDLRGIGAVTLTYIQGDRRDYFVAETRLKKLVDGFLREKFHSYFVDGMTHMGHLEAMIQEIPDAEKRTHFAKRVELLNEWHRMASSLMGRGFALGSLFEKQNP